jgi:cholesterol 25-hydroxylase
MLFDHLPPFLQRGLPGLVDCDDGWLRSWWFEPLLATASFGAFVHWYWYHERRAGVSREEPFRASAAAWDNGVCWNSAVAYWTGIYLWKIFVPPAAPTIPDGIPNNLMELAHLAAELVSGIVLYDAIFFFIHWAMHDVPPLRRWHHRHHENRRVESRDTLRHSLLDGSLQVLVNIAVQRTTPWGAAKSRTARALHNVAVVWMLTEAHSAADEPWVWRRWFVGVREHRHHHAGGAVRTRHQQFFGYLDDMRKGDDCSSAPVDEKVRDV